MALPTSQRCCRSFHLSKRLRSIRHCSNSNQPPATPTHQHSSNLALADKVGIVIFAGISVGAGCLGVWQMQRYQWKINLIEEMNSRIHLEPVQLSCDLTQVDTEHALKELVGRRISVEGQFDHGREILLGPRSPPAGLIGATAQGMATNPQVGMDIISLLLIYISKHSPILSRRATISILHFDCGMGTFESFLLKAHLLPMNLLLSIRRNAVFINRGWVPLTTQSWSRPEGIVQLSTVVGTTESGSAFSPANNPNSGKLLWLEGKALLEASGLGGIAEPVIILDAIRK